MNKQKKGMLRRIVQPAKDGLERFFGLAFGVRKLLPRKAFYRWSVIAVIDGESLVQAKLRVEHEPQFILAQVFD